MLYLGSAEIVRVSATGPDGAGKDTAYRIAKKGFPSDITIVKIGKPSSIISCGTETYIHTRVSKRLDALHEWADSTRSRLLTSAVNTMYVLWQWRVQEPYLVAKVHPNMVLSLRDGYIDPCAYAPYYTPRTLGKMPIPQRISFLKNLHGSPYRDHSIFLDVDPAIAIQRIKERVKRESAMQPGTLVRPKWQHQHENLEDLTGIRCEFLATLGYLRDSGKTRISCIDTSHISKEDAGSRLAHLIFSE